MKKIYLLVVGSCLVGALLVAVVLLPADSGQSNSATGFEPQPPESQPPEPQSPEPQSPEPQSPEPQSLEKMAWVPEGSFVMGSDFFPMPNDPNPDRIKPDEYPAHTVELDGFWMDKTPVTNQEYLEFTDMTGYVTFAESVPTREDFAKGGIDPSLIPDAALKPGSIVFNCEFDKKNLITGVTGWEYQVWAVVDGANWRHPDGPDSNIADRMDHPVVHVTWDDAVAYCDWAGKRLPTEAEFEYAARNGGKPVKYFWGNELNPDGKYLANYWQGEFPMGRLVEDGFQTSSPVKAFPPNELGLFDMAGNVWEWCADYFHSEYYRVSPRRNPKGPTKSLDYREPGLIKRVQRGGSFMCNTNSCTGYRTGARMAGEVMSSSFHNGFRCAVDSETLDSYKAAQKKIAAWKENKKTTTATNP